MSFCKRHTSIFIPKLFKMCKVIGFWWGCFWFCFFFFLLFWFGFSEKMHLIKEGQGLQCKNIVFLQFSPQRMLKDYNVIKKSDFRFKKRILKFTKEKLLLQKSRWRSARSPKEVKKIKSSRLSLHDQQLLYHKTEAWVKSCEMKSNKFSDKNRYLAKVVS